MTLTIKSKSAICNNKPGRLNREDAAKYLGCSEHTLARWASEKRGPPYFKLGRNAWYLISDLDAFIESRRVEHSVA